MRTIISVFFVIFSAFLAYYFVISIFNTFAGFVYVGIVLVGAAVIYFLFYNPLHKIVTGNANVYRTSSEKKEYMFGVSLVISVAVFVVFDYYKTKESAEIVGTIESKTLHTGIKGALYCNELQLKNGLAQCVNAQCWYGVEAGNEISIKPIFGLFGLNKLDVPCEITKHHLQLDTTLMKKGYEE